MKWWGIVIIIILIIILTPYIVGMMFGASILGLFGGLSSEGCCCKDENNFHIGAAKNCGPGFSHTISACSSQACKEATNKEAFSGGIGGCC